MDASNLNGISIDSEILSNSELTAQEKIVLAQVRQFGRYGKPCTFSNATFGQILAVSADRAGRIIARLIRIKALMVIKEDFDGRHRVLVESGFNLTNYTGENNDSASADSTYSSKPTTSIGENTEVGTQCPDENNESASADSPMQRGSDGESANLINNISLKIQIIFKAKFYSDSEYQRFRMYVLNKKQTPSQEPLDTAGRILKFANEWRPINNDTWLPEVEGEYRRAIYRRLTTHYSQHPEKMIQITHIQRNIETNTIIITVRGSNNWYNSKLPEIRKVLHNYSNNLNEPAILIKASE